MNCSDIWRALELCMRKLLGLIVFKKCPQEMSIKRVLKEILSEFIYFCSEFINYCLTSIVYYIVYCLLVKKLLFL